LAEGRAMTLEQAIEYALTMESGDAPSGSAVGRNGNCGAWRR